jgi:PST family polysaccharide transporter/lipopolysaccharide exporter
MVFLFVYFGSVYSILLKKELRFKSIAIIEIIGNLIGTTFTIYFAYSGYEELSLVYGGLITHSIRTISEIYLGWDLFFPRLYFKLGEIKEHLKFGLFNFGENFVSYIQNNWDNIIIGKILGPKYLGIYSLAIQLAVYPITKLNPIVLQVAYPVIAKMKDDSVVIKRMYLKILDLLSYFNFPLLAGLYITVDSIVPLVYGPGWEETYPLIKIFVFVAAMSCLSHPLFTLVYSKGKPNYLFYLNLITLVIKIPIVYVFGIYWHINGIAYALLLTTFIHTTLNFMIVNRLIGNFFRSFLQDLVKPLSFCLVMIFIVYLYKYFIGSTGWYNAIFEIIIGGITYLTFTLLFKYSIADVKELKKSL